ncbi:MAG: hypothetical protein ACOC8M_02380 [Guyparkeria sp.]
MNKTTGCAAVAALVAIVGCSNSGEDEVAATDASTSTQAPVTTVSPSTQESPEADMEGKQEEPDVDEAIRTYLDGIASWSPSAARDALEYAAPDSVAHAYMQHQINVAEAALDGGLQYGQPTVEAIDGGYELCDSVDASLCNEFTEIETIDGVVEDFLIDGTSPGSLLVVGNGDVVESQDVSVEFLTAYRAISSNTLFVTVGVETGEEQVELNIYSAAYRAPDGEQRQPADAMGPYEIGAESTATIALLFPEAEPGGTVTLDGYVGDDFANTVEFTIQTG